VTLEMIINEEEIEKAIEFYVSEKLNVKAHICDIKTETRNNGAIIVTAEVKAKGKIGGEKK
jgi:hypothetical protein